MILNLQMLKNLSNSKKTILSSFVAVCVIASGVVFFSSKGNSVSTIKPSIIDLKSSIDLVGTVKTVKNLDLGFEVSGRVRNVLAIENQFVKAGDLLIELTSEDLNASLNQARAELAEAESQYAQQKNLVELEQIKLQELIMGPTETEIKIAEASLQTAKENLTQAKIKLTEAENEIENEIIILINTGRNQLLDTLNQSLNTLYNLTNLQFQVYPALTSKSVQVGFHKARAAELLVGIKNAERYDTKTLSQANGGLKQSLQTDKINSIDDLNLGIAQIEEVLTQINLGLSSFVFEDEIGIETINQIDSNRSQITREIDKIISLKNSIKTLQTNNLSKVNLSQQDIKIAESRLLEAEKNLINIQSGTRETALDIQRTQIKQAESNLDSRQARINLAKARVASVQAEINKRRILAPINGWVQRVEVGKGEIAPANQSVIRLIAENELIIEVEIPERHIGRVVEGQTASIKLSSSEATIKGIVSRIDRESTLTNNVPVFKVDIKIPENDRIRSGMTGDVEIVLEERNQALSIPVSVIQSNQKGQFVEIVTNYKPLTLERVYIETGLRGDSSMIEVVSGLEIGMEIFNNSNDN